MKEVPVDAFRSISVYNGEGYVQPDPQKAHSLNHLTATKDADGSVAVEFGGCDGKVPNCLPVVKGWNDTVRLYRPHDETPGGSENSLRHSP